VSDDRGTWKLVARRDFWVRLRDRGFLISTAITLVILCGLILIRANTAIGRPVFDLGMVGSSVSPDAITRLADTQGVTVHARTFEDRTAAEGALRSGGIDAFLEDDASLVGLHDAPSAALQQVVQAAVVSERLATVLTEAGLSPEDLSSIQERLGSVSLEPGDPNADENGRVAVVMLLLLYGQLFGYGIWVSSGVIEEKSSRVVEVLLATIRPRQLLAGKIVGIGGLGLLQLAVIGVVAATLASATDVLAIPGHAFATIGVALVWFVFGFGFYASLFAVAGALVSRMEELQNAIVPINLTILGSFFVSIAAIDDPNSALATSASLVPFSSALAMPVRIAVHAAPLWQEALSLALLSGSIAVLVPLAGRLYAGAVLRIGARVKLRDAWRAAS
jgi:ABC-2 type transport system permease protein